MLFPCIHHPATTTATTHLSRWCNADTDSAHSTPRSPIMGRGRRPNLALEPTRALQTQRAFRQRKAQHLATLEQSVQLLEDENSHLRKLLNFAPRSPVSTRVKESSSPLDSSVVVKGEEQEEVERCGSCARLRQENRRLEHSAAQSEVRTVELGQTVKILQGVLANHGIPVSASMDGTMVEHRSKRMRMDPSETNGIHMTEQYFHPAEHQSGAGPSRRNGGSTWHNTPSPSALAHTPPAAAASAAGGFSPRYSLHSPSAVDEYYRRSIPPPPPSAGMNGARHNGNGGGSRLSSHPMSPAPAARQHWSTGNSSASDSPAAMSRSHHHPPPLPPHANGWSHSPPVHIPAQPDQHSRSVMGARRSGEEYTPPGQSYDFGVAMASPRMRMAGSPRDRDSSRNASHPAPSPAQATSKAQPCKPTASQDETKCCPPTNNGKSCIPQPKPPTPPETIDHRATSESWSGPPPLGVSFNMRTSTSTTTVASDATPTAAAVAGSTDQGKPDELREDDCCFGLAKCELEGQTPPSAAAAATIEPVKLDELKEDECCFGLVKCDPQGRIII